MKKSLIATLITALVASIIGIYLYLTSSQKNASSPSNPESQQNGYDNSTTKPSTSTRAS